MTIEPNDTPNIPSIAVNGIEHTSAVIRPDGSLYVDGSIASGTVNLPGPDHRAEAVVKPNAFWRTVLQVGPFAAVSLLLILPQVLQEILTAYGEQLPPGLYAALVSVTAGITITAGILAKLMANPAVQAWIAKYAPFFRATKTK